ncbi:MAG: GDYXXLXY domain-containing protein [Bacteroidia bacterium]|nr:GDYXXLXY domain-containing protein [Bacteroidia bacterium]
MKNSNIRKIIFSIYAVGLLAFPLMTVWNQQSIFDDGSIYKFKCAPIDPNDIFRGKYVQLGFDNNFIPKSTLSIDIGQTVYGRIAIDQAGYAFVTEIANVPFGKETYLELQNVQDQGDIIRFDYPFNRLYMNEEKAPKAEELFRDELSNTDAEIYARVYITEGRFLLDDVFVNEMTLKQLVE